MPDLLAGPYTGLVSGSFGNPLAGLNAWCNATAYFNTIADVSAYAGQTVQFRMPPGSDSSVGDSGWDVDDVIVQSCQTPTAVHTEQRRRRPNRHRPCRLLQCRWALYRRWPAPAMAAVYCHARRRRALARRPPSFVETSDVWADSIAGTDRLRGSEPEVEA